MSEMTFRIHFEHEDGTEDSYILTGDTVAEIREQAEAELKRRNGKYLWSEEL